MSTPIGKVLGEGNCGRATDRGKEAGAKPARLRTETAYKADSPGECANQHEAVPDRGYGKCGACAGKVHVLIRGGLESRSGSRLYAESRSRAVRAVRRFQHSAEAIVRTRHTPLAVGRAEP